MQSKKDNNVLWEPDKRPVLHASNPGFIPSTTFLNVIRNDPCTKYRARSKPLPL